MRYRQGVSPQAASAQSHLRAALTDENVTTLLTLPPTSTGELVSIDSWSFIHILSFAFLGYLYPDQIMLMTLYGVLWEGVEFALSTDHDFWGERGINTVWDIFFNTFGYRYVGSSVYVYAVSAWAHLSCVCTCKPHGASLPIRLGRDLCGSPECMPTFEGLAHRSCVCTSARTAVYSSWVIVRLRRFGPGLWAALNICTRSKAWRITLVLRRRALLSMPSCRVHAVFGRSMPSCTPRTRTNTAGLESSHLSVVWTCTRCVCSLTAVLYTTHTRTLAGLESSSSFCTGPARRLRSWLRTSSTWRRRQKGKRRRRERQTRQIRRSGGADFAKDVQ